MKKPPDHPFHDFHRKYPPARQFTVRQTIAIAAATSLVLLAAGFCLGQAWNGQDSRETLSYTEALEIIADQTASQERRRSALGRIYRLSEEAGQVTRRMALTDNDEQLRHEARVVRARVRIRWEAP